MMWKTIPGWPYEVSDAGAVRRLGATQPLTPMRCGRKRKQYSVVTLCHQGRHQNVKVHHLVLTAFIGPRTAKALGLHKDDDTWNNTATNLYWGTPTHNADDARYTGSKVTPAQVQEIKRRRMAGEKGAILAREFHISQQLVCDIYKGRSYADPHPPEEPEGSNPDDLS